MNYIFIIYGNHKKILWLKFHIFLFSAHLTHFLFWESLHERKKKHTHTRVWEHILFGRKKGVLLVPMGENETFYIIAEIRLQ